MSYADKLLIKNLRAEVAELRERAVRAEADAQELRELLQSFVGYKFVATCDVCDLPSCICNQIVS